MADERRVVISSEPFLTPEEVARRTFATVFRGFDTVEVRAYLRRVSDELGVARERQRHLEHLLAEAQSRSSAPPPPLDEASLTAALGEETARVLHTAREAAADIKAKAQENVERLLHQAHEDAARIREESEGIYAIKEAEATEAAETIRAEARAEAEAVVEAARDQARQMLEEAKEVRAKVLGDIVRRRNVARVQVAQLRAGRGRLLDAYRVVRETLDQVTAELGQAEDEARQAAEQAGQKVGAELAADAEAELAALDPELLGEPAPIDLAADLPEPALAVVAVDEPAPAIEVEGAAEEALAPEAGPEATEPEPEPEPESEPAVASAVASAVEPARPEVDAAPVEQLPEAPLDIVEPPSDIEAVRLIVPTVDEEPEPEPEPAPVAERAEPVERAEPEERAEPDEPDEGAPVDALFARIRAGREEAVAKAHQVLADATAAEVAPSNGSAPTATQEEPGAVLLRRRDSELEPMQAQLAKRLKRAMQDEQNDVLDRLRVHRGRPGLGDVLPEAADQGARYREVARPLLDQAGRAGAGASGQPDASADVAGLVDELADAITGPLRRRLDDAFATAAREEDDVPATVERVGAAYREWKMQRIERLAADNLAAAFALGGYAATATGTPMRWVVDDVDGPCPDCDDNALASPTPAGEPYPTGQVHPPAHAGCHCLLVPVGD